MNKSDIDRICGSVDMYEALQRPINTWRPFGSGSTRVGIKDLVNSVDNIIDNVFNDAGLLHLSHKDVNYFFEFSILPTVLDPVRPDELECFSYLWGDKLFKEIFTVKPGDTLSIYEKVIVDILKYHGISVFHHPNFLFDIGANGTDPVTMTAVCGKGIRIISTKNAEEKAIMMPRSFSETIQQSKSYYSSPNFKSLREVQESLHQEIVSRIKDTENTYFISFPIIGAHSSNQLPHNIVQRTLGTTPTQGVGSFFLYIESNNITPHLASIISEKLYVSICDLGRLYAVNYLFNLGLQLQENARREAEKSAKAAIMSRNMSHNLGSHVMSYLKQHLGTVKDMINDKILSEIIDGEVDLTKTLDKNVDTIALPFLLGLGHFISYLQERQDFIATIATDYIPYYSTINFKDDIYDVLNPDKRAERHPERDKTSNMKMDNILLGNVARSEGLGRPTRPTDVQFQTNGSVEKLGDIVLRFGKKFNGNPVKKDSPEDKDLQKMRVINFSLPGGIVGRQAIFSILENVIRNAAKHGKWHKSGKLQLTFNIYDRWSDIPYEDNDDGDLSLKEVFENFYFNASDRNDLYFVTITDNCEIDADNLAKLRAALQDDYIDASGVMKDGNKGLKEMRISSAWIRSLRDESTCFSPEPRYNENDTNEKKGKTLEELKHDKGWPKLSGDTQMIAPLLYARIRAIRIKKEVRNRNLQYVFCVPKPRKVAIISDKTMGEEVKIRLINNCWRVFNKEEFENEPNKSFEFILCDEIDDNKAPNLYNAIRPMASSRVYKLSQIEGLNRTSFFADVCNCEISDDDYKKVLSSYEELLYKKLSSFEDGDIIRIEDDRAKDGVTHDGNRQEDEIRIGDVMISGTPHPGKFIYRTHHEAYKLFKKFMDGEHSETIFVEGISGNNSTDRLIRNEEKNSIWFYRHLHAIKQQIAVFDERLYSRIGLKTTMDYSKDHMAVTYLQKGIYVFTLIEDQNTDSNGFGLYGISLNNGNPKLGEKYECLCDRLATLTYHKDRGMVIEATVGGSYILNKFDFISIHQGLLDKLYDSFGIKKQLSKQEVNIEKIRLTNQLYLYLSNSEKDRCVSNQEEWLKIFQEGKVLPWKDGFAPGFVIHSGRSKPGENDMPQRLPFLQYAAIEHSILDCKYSLVELLDYARYEK